MKVDTDIDANFTTEPLTNFISLNFMGPALLYFYSDQGVSSMGFHIEYW